MNLTPERLQRIKEDWIHQVGVQSEQMWEMIDALGAARTREQRYRSALQEAAEYYETLERASGVEHGVLKVIRAALAEEA